MTMRQSTNQATRRWLAASLCLTLTMMGCSNVEHISHGRQFTKEGKVEVGALMPSCGCISLQNTTPNKVAIESYFFGIRRGSLMLAPGEVTRALFDWAGSENSDVYELVAYNAGPDGTGREQARAQDVLREFAPASSTPCADRECPFGQLAMNRMLETEEVEQRQTARRGVNFSSVIEASAPLDECGCMVLKNISDKTVTLRATLHGAETGQMDLAAGATAPVPFDWSGNLDTDVYTVEAVGAAAANQPPPVPDVTAPVGDGQRTAMTIRLKQYIEITGTFVGMTCKAHEAEFTTRAVDQSEVTVRCPWAPHGKPGLGMHVAYDARAKHLSQSAPGSETKQ
jgi:hypothetical protein